VSADVKCTFVGLSVRGVDMGAATDLRRESSRSPIEPSPASAAQLDGPDLTPDSTGGVFRASYVPSLGRLFDISIAIEFVRPADGGFTVPMESSLSPASSAWVAEAVTCTLLFIYVVGHEVCSAPDALATRVGVGPDTPVWGPPPASTAQLGRSGVPGLFCVKFEAANCPVLVWSSVVDLLICWLYVVGHGVCSAPDALATRLKVGPDTPVCGHFLPRRRS